MWAKGPLLARHLGDPSNGLNYHPLEKINWNAADQYHPIQYLLFLCNTYHRQPNVRFMERLVLGICPGIVLRFWRHRLCKDADFCEDSVWWREYIYYLKRQKPAQQYRIFPDLLYLQLQLGYLRKNMAWNPQRAKSCCVFISLEGSSLVFSVLGIQITALLLRGLKDLSEDLS